MPRLATARKIITATGSEVTIADLYAGHKGRPV